MKRDGTMGVVLRASAPPFRGGHGAEEKVGSRRNAAVMAAVASDLGG